MDLEERTTLFRYLELYIPEQYQLMPVFLMERLIPYLKELPGNEEHRKQITGSFMVLTTLEVAGRSAPKIYADRIEEVRQQTKTELVSQLKEASGGDETVAATAAAMLIARFERELKRTVSDQMSLGQAR